MFQLTTPVSFMHPHGTPCRRLSHRGLVHWRPSGSTVASRVQVLCTCPGTGSPGNHKGGHSPLLLAWLNSNLSSQARVAEPPPPHARPLHFPLLLTEGALTNQLLLSPGSNHTTTLPLEELPEVGGRPTGDSFSLGTGKKKVSLFEQRCCHA